MKFVITKNIYPNWRTRSVTARAWCVIIKCLPQIMVALGSAVAALAAHAAMSPTSVELEKLRIQIEAHPIPDAELHYLALFPKTFAEFTKIFSFQYSSSGYALPNEELEKTHAEHLRLLEKLAMKYPQQVLDIWLSVSIDGKESADAVSYLQSQLAEYAAKETEIFAAALLAKPDAQRKSIIKFLADVENFSGYPEYETILGNLEKLGHTKLRRLFSDAKAQRIKYRHSPGE
ncbi:MAG: hypothetical protein AABY83_01955 [Pseudomonadota bacterium]